jgi:hypothetical protein
MTANALARSDCTLLVASCDRYSDLWIPYFTLLQRHWPDCPFPIALITERSVPVLPGVSALSLGGGMDWSSLLLAALDKLESPFVLLTLEDFFLRRKVPSERLVRLLDEVREQRLEMLRLIPRPGPRGMVCEREYGMLPPHTPYRVSTQAAFWRVATLRKLLVPGESPWEFELKGTQRSADMSGFACVRRSALPYRHHVVERGRWFPWAAYRFRRQEIGVDLAARPVMSFAQVAKWLAGKAFAPMLLVVPRRIRALAKQVQRQIQSKA